jgi:DNA-binding MarR family transcriptional regulator
MPAPATLDEFVCFAMYTASHATTQAYREVLKPWKLTYPQYLAMVVLATGERTVAARRGARLDSGTLSPLLRRLEERGLVRRRRDADDERVVRVALTAAGRHARRGRRGRGVPRARLRRQRARLGELLEQLAAITANMRALAADLRTAA